MKSQMLKKKISDAGVTMDSAASAAGMDRSTLYRKLKRDCNTFTVEEMNKLVAFIHLSAEEASQIFF